MLETLGNILSADYMPHGYCYLWLPEILWLHVASDAAIAVAYFIIPVSLTAVVVRRQTVPFPRMVWMFGAFITACGMTHVLGIWTIWQPAYGIEGAFKAFTGALSLTTAILLVPLIPTLVALPDPQTLARVNRLLEAEIRERERIEQELRRARDELADRVEERTAALTAANQRLQAEVQERERAEQRMQHLAYHDLVTELPNRVLLQDRMGQALAQARRDRSRVAVMVLDLDHFKHVNDTLGHLVGDQLLRAVARRLLGALRATDTLARVGGDEFAVIQTELQDPEGAAVLAQKLAAALASPFELDGHEVHIGTSIGITIFPEDGATPEQLLANADMALYRAKDRARGGFHFFEPDLIRNARRRQKLERCLRGALRCGDLCLHYQPQIDFDSRRIVEAEALVRWPRRSKGLVMPETFIGAAEATGLIRPLGVWVLREACRRARGWQGLGHPMAVAVNVSPMQLRGQDFVGKVAAILAETGLDPPLLHLEITENLFLEHDAAEEVLAGLAGLGIGLVIDDFGTGFSSLAYLQRFPIQKIKIDRSFVARIGVSRDAEAIVQAIIGLGHSLGIRVTAEGVEQAAQFEFLRAEGCDEVQGFYIDRPMPAEVLAERLGLIAA